MKKFLPVLLEYENKVNPEPGVPRAPTFGEQAAALERMAQRLGGMLIPVPYVARQGQGVGDDVHSTLESEKCDGILFFAMEAIRRGTQLDTKCVARLHQDGYEVGLLIEDKVVRSLSELEDLLDFLHVINAVRDRDASPSWAEVVAIEHSR